MGVYLSINGYQKNSTCIVGHISFLGLYEVKTDSIQKFKIRENSISHYGDLYLISESKNDWRDLGLFEQDLLFYTLATNYWSGQSLGKYQEETTCLMFDPSMLLKPIDRFIAEKDSIINSFRGTYKEFLIQDIEQSKEVDFFVELKSLIEESIKKDAIIGIVFS
ncbi:hypothetical protein ESA94_05185 [Lacibacter luteus]|uniref:Uncharacterized protein n=1 Tax=Lacibacter luteus TaxID=2508719 RepID=A0A4Q1CNK1_9BACT|nr:hypothetical protein [Lacibacter luteus]RXK62404.1 hypothetical protein ESA94_05185 [Lacibacter luteus]